MSRDSDAAKVLFNHFSYLRAILVQERMPSFLNEARSLLDDMENVLRETSADYQKAEETAQKRSWSPRDRTALYDWPGL